MTGRSIFEILPVAGRNISLADMRGKFDSQYCYFSKIPLPVLMYLSNCTEYQNLRGNFLMISGFYVSFLYIFGTLSLFNIEPEGGRCIEIGRSVSLPAGRTPA